MAKAPDNPASRRALAHSLLRSLPLERVIEQTQSWPLGEIFDLVGLVRVAIEEKAMPQSTPGLGLFAALLPEQAAGEFAIASDDEWRDPITPKDEWLDQIHWPMLRDAELAWWAAAQVEDLHPSCRDAVQTIGRCLHREGVAPAVLAEIRAELEPICWGSYLPAAGGDRDDAMALQIFGRVTHDKGESAKARFLAARRTPMSYAADVHIAYNCSQAALLSRRGWMAYHAHRRLPSLTASSAGIVAEAVANRLGPNFWRQFVRRALTYLLP